MASNKSSKFKRPVWLRWILTLCAMAAICAATFGIGLYGVGGWINYSEKPQKSDLLVVLAGSFARPFYAAELFGQGYASEIWISRPRPDPIHRLPDKLGISLPREEDINYKILTRLGVPAKKIHIYGNGVLSTVEEVLAFKSAANTQGKKILVVTSCWHARRSQMIFRDVLPEASVRVVAAPQDPIARPWWKEQRSARNAVLEIVKTIYYLAGGRFLSQKESMPPYR